MPKYDELSFDEIADGIEQVVALERLARVELLAMTRSLVGRAELADDGCRSVASWLCMRLGIAHFNAADIERVAVATASLPFVLGAFESGALSWDKLVLVCQFATAETDEQFANECPAMNMRQLRRLARRAREVPPKDALGAHEKRHLKLIPSRDGLTGRIEGLLPIEGFVTVRKMIEEIGNEVGPDESGNYLPVEKLNADALVEICSTGLVQESLVAKTAVVVNADVEFLAGLVGTADIDFTGVLGQESVRRILCSASVELAITEDGKTIGSGRATRLFPPKVLTAMMGRDQGCRFPGCHRRRWLHGHHVKEWQNGGRSDEDNGIILCDTHHLFVHERGWRIEGSVYGALRFIRPDGKVFTGMPPIARAKIRQTVDHWLDRAG